MPGNEGFCLGANCSGDGLAIFRVVDVNQAPAPRFFAVDLGFDTVGGYGDSSLRIVAWKTQWNSDHAVLPFTWIATPCASRTRAENMPPITF